MTTAFFLEDEQTVRFMEKQQGMVAHGTLAREQTPIPNGVPVGRWYDAAGRLVEGDVDAVVFGESE